MTFQLVKLRSCAQIQIRATTRQERPHTFAIE